MTDVYSQDHIFNDISLGTFSDYRFRSVVDRKLLSVLLPSCLTFVSVDIFRPRGGALNEELPLRPLVSDSVLLLLLSEELGFSPSPW